MEKSFCKGSFQVDVDLKKVQKQGRDERTQEDCTFAVYFCICRVVFLRSFLSALFLYLFQVHPYLKWRFRKIFLSFNLECQIKGWHQAPTPNKELSETNILYVWELYQHEVTIHQWMYTKSFRLVNMYMSVLRNVSTCKFLKAWYM